MKLPTGGGGLVCNSLRAKFRVHAHQVEMLSGKGKGDCKESFYLNIRRATGQTLRLLPPVSRKTTSLQPIRVKVAVYVSFTIPVSLYQQEFQTRKMISSMSERATHRPRRVAGLVFTKRNDWIDVPNLPNVIIVNIGDALELWTAGRLRSTLHRVTFPRSERENVGRLSIPFFVQPDKEVVLSP
ncbi:hypothetical protein ARAM_003379 [Aspergillus rambellii]|uniref:Isopenicillin N synthase-like Fe(2+) 2OG dioxygenase domain-containing protein n=1 Tax=Aspergillus rambellii TaxID=308745 RepID=A0A0F8V9V1_9EURO|nr:hypothetical protein ARAM_003379 [Aspergillus rambellii]